MRLRYYLSSTLAVGIWLNISEEIKNVVVAMHSNEILWIVGCFVVAFITAFALPRVLDKHGKKIWYAVGTGASLWALGFVALWSARLSVNTLALQPLLVASAWSLSEMVVASLIVFAVYKYMMMIHLRSIEPRGI
jgi:hypothetical protein